MRLALVFISMILVPSWAFSQNAPAPKGWKRVTSCEFSFLLPATTREETTHPVDSCLANFQYKDLSISLDYGLYSSPLSEQDWMRNYQTTSITINGRKASLITYEDAMNPKSIQNITKVHVITSKATPPFLGNVSLLMVISTKSSKDHEIIKKIYESLTFRGTPTAKNEVTTNPKSEPVDPSKYEGWVKIDAKTFSFYAPKYTQGGEKRGIDTTVYDFAGPGVTIKFDIGDLANPLPRHGTPTKVINIDGHTASIFHSYTGKRSHLHIAIDNKAIGGGNFNMYVYYEDPDVKETAEKMFLSLRFK